MAIQPQPMQSPPPPRRAKKARLGNLNMGIAQTHRIATQFVGIQLSGANLLALTVSAASVVAGTVSLVAQRYAYNWPLFISAGIIGLGLALLIEGLTLGSLIRIRLANRAIRQIEEKIENEKSAVLAALKLPDPAQPNARQTMHQYRRTVHLIQQDYRCKRQQATSLQRKQRRFSYPLATLGAISSAIAGGLFYHTILAGLGQVESLILAVLFPLVVTGTFVSSEIHKDAQEDAIKEGFGGGALTETAIREETKLHSALAVHQKVMAYLEKPEAELAIEEGAKHLLHDILAELRETSRQVTPRVILTEETDDATRQLTTAKETGDTASSGTVQAGDTTFSRAKEEDGDTTPPSLGTLPAQGTGTTIQRMNQQDQQKNSGRLPPRPLLSEQAQNAPQSGECQRLERDQIFSSDRTTSPVAQQRNQDNACLPDSAKNPVVSWMTIGNQKRRQTRPLSQERASVQGSEATIEHDLLTTQILAYLAEHDHARQLDVAQALGVTVRTVQRKLAALKQQQAHR